MVRIRREQMEALRRPIAKRFEDEMYAYLVEVFPEQCGAEGEPAVRDHIRKGMQRAEEYGITIEADVARYVELMYVWSPEFDEDPDLPWAQAVLTTEGLDGTRKVERLWAETEARMPDDESGAETE